jgi:hypothetical protein
MSPRRVEGVKGEPVDPAMPPWLRRLFEPVDIASVAFFRICFGFLMSWHTLQYLTTGRLGRQYLTPVFFFKFPGFEWVKPWPSQEALRFWFGALALIAVLIAIGFFYRTACALFCVGITYIFLLDASVYQNHTYLISLLAFLMILVPVHRAFSIDAMRRRDLRSETVPVWVLWLLRFQVAIPYVYGGIAKLNYDWMVRAEPMRTWFQDGTEGPLQSELLKEPWAAYAMSWGGAAYDLLIVPLLLWRRTRIPAFLLSLVFHLMNSQLFTIGIFPWLMIAATLLYFPPDWPRRLKLLGARRPGQVAARTGRAPKSTVPWRATVAFLAVYVAFQLLFPFRHFLYPGNVEWTDEAHRFSWRMKLRDKRGDLGFVAVDPAARKAYPLDEAEAVLTDAQRRKMIHDPDMIRQFARFVGDGLRKTGYPVQVRAITSISLNGRPAQPMIDPEVDLSSIPRRLGAAEWIVPLKPSAD